MKRCGEMILYFMTLSMIAPLRRAAPAPLYLDASQPIAVRVDDLMARMTLKEKIGQLNLPCAYVKELGSTSEEKMEAARKFAAGTYTNEIGPGAGFFTLADTIRINDTKAPSGFL